MLLVSHVIYYLFVDSMSDSATTEHSGKDKPLKKLELPPEAYLCKWAAEGRSKHQDDIDLLICIIADLEKKEELEQKKLELRKEAGGST